MKKALLIGALLAQTTTFGASKALAQVPDWVMDGAGCVPIDSAIQQDLYLITAGRIKFKPEKTGSITVICPVSVNVKNANNISVSYRDSTGRSTNARVTAALRRIRKRDGAVNTVSGLVFNSDTRSETAYTFEGSSTSSESGHTFDHFNYYYYVQTALVRRSSSNIVEFGGVELGRVIF
ncbi:MAG: hypothetical protein F6K50_39910 [Moorea sp. SIO3I7]|uniref:Uncharacterized protein n=1 Tax=Moorena bouillonii PNG TaxID=568701 RepID=A0A1U7MZR0_9CYAN|nr:MULTISPECIES: hypothetical protein [Moorena]NEO01350.1 hypothetical protein [Moorena sp. SIO3I7]NEO50051.1 hypothetical protein [Moorena sp. SIO4A3]NEO61805.1 hypothetical protein [Moorena sp. SIO4G2]NEO10818.1 hypothetical protein [Moorena sp. SIO3E8]NEO25297.1 hypothetical protein [Moorena sp. SIO4A5]